MTENARTLDLRLPLAPEALSFMRKTVGGWLRQLGFDYTAISELELVCTEVCANAIEHGRSNGDREIELTGKVVAGYLRLEVKDGGRWQFRLARPGRGNGMKIVRALMDQVAVRRYSDGTGVVMYRRLQGADGPASAAHRAA